MDTSRKTEITTIVEGAEVEIESAGTQPSISANEEILLSGKEKLNQGAEASIQEASLARDQKGGGPRTVLGKQKSKFNASKHGIFSQVTLLKGEPRAEFDSLLSGLRTHYEPEGTLEGLLVDKLASIVWRHRRLIIVMGKREGTNSLGVDNIFDAWTQNQPKPLDLLLRYESSLERAFDRALGQLERLQKIRKGESLPPTLNVNLDLP